MEHSTFELTEELKSSLNRELLRTFGSHKVLSQPHIYGLQIPLIESIDKRQYGELSIDGVIRTVNFSLTVTHVTTKISNDITDQPILKTVLDMYVKQVVQKILGSSVDTLILRVPGKDTFNSVWIVTNPFCHITSAEPNDDSLDIIIEITFALGAVIWTSLDQIKRFDQHRLKFMTELSKNDFINLRLPVKYLLRITEDE